MRWNWCMMCKFDGHCENQDRNIECACYAREQTLRAEQYGNLIEKLEHENLLLKIANAELRDQVDTINTRLEKAFYDDNTSFWDALIDIRKTLKKDSTNGKE